MKNKGKIFIPFIDGILSYNCRECGYFCCQSCQSGLIVMNAKEKKMLLQKYPSLRYFSVKETKKTYWLRRYTRCWFLESNGLCYIHKKHGSSFKPFICRLHPFYVFRCKNEYIVLPDRCTTLCVDRENKNKNISHGRIYKNAQEAIDNDHIIDEIRWSKKRLNLEKKILEDSKMFLDKANYLDFSAYQISRAAKNRDIKDIKSELLERIKLWKLFFNIDDLNIDNKILTFELTAITSLIRIASIDLNLMEEDKVPLVLLALYFYMTLFLKDRKIKTYVETYKEILSDVALLLLHVKKDDLNIKNRSIETKLNYLRLLQKLHTHKLMHKAKKTERKC